MTVSVIIPIFNRSATILRASHSVLAEDQVSELILIDDGSSDNFTSVLQEIKKACRRSNAIFHFHQNLVNMGPAYSRNKGVSLSSNDIIAFHDADDIWILGKLKYQLKMLKSQEDLVIGNMTTKFSNSKRLIRQNKHLNLPATVQKVLDGKFSTTTPTMLMYKRTFLEANGFDANLRLREDHDFFIRHIRNGGVIKCGKREVAIRIYDGYNYSKSLNVFRRYRAELQFLVKHKAALDFSQERKQVISRLVRLNADYSISGSLIAVREIGILKLIKIKLNSIISYSIQRFL